MNLPFSLGESGADQRPATAPKKGTAVGLLLHDFLRLFAVHRYRTATQVVYSTQARHKVNCPKGKRGSPGGYQGRAIRECVMIDRAYEDKL